MSLQMKLESRGFKLSDIQSRRVQHRLQALERRLEHRPAPAISVVMTAQPNQRRIDAAVNLQLGPLGPTLSSHAYADVPAHAVRMAVLEIERQLERHVSGQRGEAVYGVPSRRLPRELRPNPPAPACPLDWAEQ